MVNSEESPRKGAEGASQIIRPLTLYMAIKASKAEQNANVFESIAIVKLITSDVSAARNRVFKAGEAFSFARRGVWTRMGYAPPLPPRKTYVATRTSGGSMHFQICCCVFVVFE